ncbi:XRE family transcriptional regulator [Paenibacillus lemnae]|uniref:XRE family transcriptional regulator n=2 Tax=Paenibacillus lemnae TaxID=1330551 RepID=A0A848MAK2_PAELE|nr:XRE family transcriptional regulator [Paenibacillus lemnae]
MEAEKSAEWLADELRLNPKRIYDFIENKRVMPLKMAISIADTIRCDVGALYELIPNRIEQEIVPRL